MPGRAGDLHGDEALPGRAACELEETRSPPPRWRSRSARRARAPPRPEPWPPGRAMVRTRLMRARPATATEQPAGRAGDRAAWPQHLSWPRPTTARREELGLTGKTSGTRSPRPASPLLTAHHHEEELGLRAEQEGLGRSAARRRLLSPAAAAKPEPNAPKDPIAFQF